jgi:hypothetical protein
MKIETEMEIWTCANCGVLMVAAPAFFSNRRDDHQTFYCLSGHGNYFPQKSEAETLRAELAQEKTRTITLQEQLDKAVMPKKRGRPRKPLTPKQ